MSSLLSFMNNSHRNRSDRKQSTRKDMVVSTTGNLALPTLKSSSKIPISLSAALSKGSREGLPSVNANNSSSMRSILSPREISSSKVEAQSTLRSSAIALLTSSSSDAAALSQSNIPLSIKQRQITPSSTSTGYTTRVSPRSSFSNGLLTSISNNIIGRSTSSIKENACSVSTTGDNNASLVCDKCDGKHATEKCPHFKKERDSHPDAQKNFYQKLLEAKSSLPGQMIARANVIRQPGNGSCLFHSLATGLGGDANATKLRAEICAFIAANPDFKICETPLSDWIKW